MLDDLPICRTSLCYDSGVFLVSIPGLHILVHFFFFFSLDCAWDTRDSDMFPFVHDQLRYRVGDTGWLSRHGRGMTALQSFLYPFEFLGRSLIAHVELDDEL